MIKGILWLVGGFLGTALVVSALGSEPQPTTTPQPTPITTVAPTPVEEVKPIIETKTITETEVIPFDSSQVYDSTLEEGKTRIRTSGRNGVKTLIYEVTFTGGVETSRKLVKTEITTQPATKIVVIGTKKNTPKCDPNYSGACVPIASDVDCAGGSGNGPAYVRGPVYVIGYDIYGLDRDGDGVGCEN